MIPVVKIFQFAMILCLVQVKVSGDDECSGMKELLQGYMSGQASASCITQPLETTKKEMIKTMEMMQAQMKTAIGELKKYMQDYQGPNSSVVFTRWGMRSCPSGAELVYTGYAGGSHYSHSGGAAEFLCLPRDPQWGIHVDGHDGGYGLVYGAEYQTSSLHDSRKRLHDHDVPCAVCLSHGRSVLKMIPARKACYNGWNVEYNGYLMAGYNGHASASEYICVDAHPEAVNGGHQDQDGKLVYKVEAACGSLKCPPYVSGRELTCVVCTRSNSSVIYRRWGRKTCPALAELVYSGYAGCSHYSHSGGAAEFLCLPRDHQWGIYVDGYVGDNAYVYGTEYETSSLKDSRKRLHDQDVPCAVCLSQGRSVMSMFPARKACYKGWNLEYNGYLMAGYHASPSATEYVCIDGHPEGLNGGHQNHDGKLLYKVEPRCGPLKCPPYVKGRELTCVVCTR